VNPEGVGVIFLQSGRTEWGIKATQPWLRLRQLLRLDEANVRTRCVPDNDSGKEFHAVAAQGSNDFHSDKEK
jgi:hypothetical protein